jgi:hypothetical protein
MQEIAKPSATKTATNFFLLKALRAGADRFANVYLTTGS